jgi:integrase
VLDAGVRAANNYAKGFLMGPQNEVQKKKRQVSAEKRANGQGSIYYVPTKTGKRSYKAAIHDMNGKRRTKTFKSKTEAEDWLSDQKRSRNAGQNTYANNPKMTVAEFMNKWLQEKYGTEETSTKRFYGNAIRIHIIPAFGKLKASALSAKAIENHLRDMAANGAGEGTVKSVRATLSVAFSDAVRHGDLPRNPVLHVVMPNMHAKPTKPIPRKDWEKIYIKAMEEPYMHARVEIGGIEGLRPGEALGLKWSDLNVEENTLYIERQAQRIKGKGIVLKAVKQKEERPILISNEAIRILLTHKRHQALQKAHWDEDNDLIFPNSVGKLQDEKADRNRFKKLCRDAWVKEYQVYQMRKTAFTNMASLTDPRTLLDYTGHSNLAVVMKSYVFTTDESMKRAVEGMDKLRPTAG